MKQPGFTDSACGPFTKHLHILKNSKHRETGNLKHLYRNKLDKVGFTYDRTYFDSENLAKRTISDKILKDRAYESDRNRGHNGYQRALGSVHYKFFDKKTGLGVSVNEQIAEELRKPVTKTFRKIKSMHNLNTKGKQI